MALTAGTKLGPYEILAPIGAGGMGEVYRARDTNLDRDVAIKVLPSALAQDRERLARFDREAKVLATLNHPNIAQIYGVEQGALVMELIEGENLCGPVPLATALDYARQIADALEAAHEKGIVHRDLKPANIKITPDSLVKVLDFGLATAVQGADRDSVDSANSPTLTMGATEVGVILGTAAYMSPEQASGKRVDKRADIWSFGVVLWEMLTGKRLFDAGETVSHTLADVLRAPINFTELPTSTPEPIHELLKRCLDRDVKTRLRDIGEARVAIAKCLADPASRAPIPAQIRTPTTRVPWAVTTVLAFVAAAGWWIAWRATRPVEHPLMRLSVDLGPDAVPGGRITAAISPDGTRIAFGVRAGGRQLLATRLLDQAAPTVLSGTDNGADPFFSPDGQWIGFFADGKLKKISVLGGAALTLCDAPSGRGATWGDDDYIVASLSGSNRAGLSRVPAAGGVPETLTKPLDKGEGSHRWPHILPGGQAVLFTGNRSTTAWDDANIEAVSLKSGGIKILVRGGYFPRYLATGGATGHLVYIHEGVLFGVPFDPVRLDVSGVAAPLLDDVAATAATGGGQFDVSRHGTLVYLSGKSSTASWPVMWMDRSGKMQPLLAKPGTYNTPRFSPDGNWLALSVTGGRGSDLYLYDWHHDTMPRLTFNAKGSSLPTWTSDAKHIAFATPDGLWWVRADGAGEPLQLLESKNPIFPNSFSPDAKRLAYAETTAQTRTDILTLPLDMSDPEHPKPGKPESFLSTPAGESFGIFSPDGRWMAYASDESGQPEVYVRPFPGPGGKWQISTGGGSVSVWSRDGHELFYVSLDDRIMVADYTAKGDSFSYSKPRLWSDKQIFEAGGRRFFDLAPDGKRFAVFPRPDLSEEKQGNVHLTFLLNFPDELRRRVPGK